MSGDQLFDRIIELEIFVTSPERLSSGNSIAGGNIKINSRALDIEFDVTKTNSSENNKGEVKIYNLSDEVRSLIRLAKPATMIVSAGYGDNTGVNTCYIGDIVEVYPEREGGDIITVITLATGLTATRQMAVSKSWGGKVALSEVINYVLNSTGMTIKEPRRYRDHTWNRGYTINSNPLESLKSTVRNLGMEMSVTDNEIDIYHPRDILKTEIVVLNKNTGLVGIPEAITDVDEERNFDKTKESGKEDPNKVDSKNKTLLTDGYKVTSLLNSALTPNAKISLTSERIDAVNSLLKIDKVRHHGSNFGDVFYSEVECFEEEIK